MRAEYLCQMKGLTFFASTTNQQGKKNLYAIVYVVALYRLSKYI